MVDLDEATLNQLFATLEDWNVILADLPDLPEEAPPPKPPEPSAN